MRSLFVRIHERGSGWRWLLGWRASPRCNSFDPREFVVVDIRTLAERSLAFSGGWQDSKKKKISRVKKHREREYQPDGLMKWNSMRAFLVLFSFSVRIFKLALVR